MSIVRENVISIAGLDPSGGAGLLADIKTFEMHRVNGLGVCSALTYQNDIELDGVEWMEASKIIQQLEVLFRRFKVDFVKIGVIENLATLNQICDFLLENNKQTKIVWDPIIKASSGFEFANFKENLNSVFGKIFLMTPNKKEFENLFESEAKALEISKQMKIYLKGGHNEENLGLDILMNDGVETKFEPSGKKCFPKHGSGCILSSALCANLALGYDLIESCKNAKQYVENALSSNNGLLSHHN